MGQDWLIVNIDTREHLGSWGKLGEFYSEIPYTSTVSVLAGSWQNCRIMCAGNYMRECPPDVLTSDETAEINDLPDEIQHKTLYMLARRTYAEISSYDLYELEGTVLRNRTKHIYVRRDVVVKELARYRGDIFHVLLANICWSDDRSCAMNIDITRGAWAGDRLDLKLLCTVENEEEWEDVTEDQVKFTRFVLKRSDAPVYY
ncbi:hypothetical protein IW262DRAFT_1405977 [Armillaria fumosa]|nr:hypothetical protein IW262DRAFT_1405977 [Armillaria fumosa]